MIFNIRSRPMVVVLLAFCGLSSVAQSELPPLTAAELDLIVAETQAVSKALAPVPPAGRQPSTWTTLDRSKLARLLQMRQFATLSLETRQALLGQAGAWDLMPFSRPSDALAMWQRWLPDRADYFQGGYADERWASESGAMMALLHCYPQAAWYAQGDDPMYWAVGGTWMEPRTAEFESCVRDGRAGRFREAATATRIGAAWAAVLEHKFSTHLLAHGCTGAGPDHCLLMLHALHSLNPRHPRLVQLVKTIEKELALEGEIVPPAAFMDRWGRDGPRLERWGQLSKQEIGELKLLARAATHRIVLSKVKLSLVVDQPQEWPAGELDRELRKAMHTAVNLSRINHLTGSGGLYELARLRWISPWLQLYRLDRRIRRQPLVETPAAVARSLARLGKEYAEPAGCGVAPSWAHNAAGPPEFWAAYAVEKLEREQTGCDALPKRWIGRLYAELAAQRQALPPEPIGELRRLIVDERLPLEERRDIVAALGRVVCADPAVADPWQVCALKESMPGVPAAERSGSERSPGECPENFAANVADLLHPDEAPHQLACKVMPNDPQKAIVAATTLHPGTGSYEEDDSDQGEYDLHVAIARLAGGRIVSRLKLEKEYASDAYRLSFLGIDTARYQLAKDNRAFGVLAGSTSGRRPPVGETVLSLFVQDGPKLRQVLSGLAVIESRGDVWACDSEAIETTHRRLKIGTSHSHGWADLVVESTREISAVDEEKPNCNSVSGKASVVRLRFDGQRYPVPKE